MIEKEIDLLDKGDLSPQQEKEICLKCLKMLCELNPYFSTSPSKISRAFTFFKHDFAATALESTL